MMTLSRYRPALFGLLATAALAAGACNRAERPVAEEKVAQGSEAPAPEPYVLEEPGAPSAPEPGDPVRPEGSPDSSRDGSQELAGQPGTTGLQPPGELKQEPQVVVIQPEEPRRGTSAPRSVDERERRLAERQAELDAREARLRREERERRAQERAVEEERQARQAEADDRAEDAGDLDREPEPSDRRSDRRSDQIADEDLEPAPEPERAEEPRTVEVSVPEGASLDVEFTRSLSSATASVGDTFRVRVAESLREDGVVAIPAGSELVGEVTDVASLRRVGGQARLGVRFTDLVLPSGQTVPIDASFLEQGKSETRRDAATIGGAAAGGAILGRILNKGNKTRGSVIGAIIGAAAGTAIASRTPGEEVTIPEGAVIAVQFDRPVEFRRRL